MYLFTFCSQFLATRDFSKKQDLTNPNWLEGFLWNIHNSIWKFILNSFSDVLFVIIFVIFFEICISFQCWTFILSNPSLSPCELFLQFPFAQSADCIIKTKMYMVSKKPWKHWICQSINWLNWWKMKFDHQRDHIHEIQY